MTCREIDNLIVNCASGAAVPEAAAAHLSACARCSRLVRAMRESRRPAPPSREQRDRMAAAVPQDLEPVKPLAPEGTFFVALLLAIAVTAALGGGGLGAAGFRALSRLQCVVVFGGLGIGSALLAFSAARQMVPGRKLVPLPLPLLAGGAGAMAAIAAVVFQARHESAFVAEGLECLRTGVGFALAAGIPIWLLLRRGAILYSGLAGATAGALAGLGGIAVLEIACPNLNAYHILAWHVGAVFASALGGLAIGCAAEYRVRRRPPD